MSADPKFSEHQSLNVWGEAFMSAATANQRRRLPLLERVLRWKVTVALAVAIAIPTGAGIAVATGVFEETVDPPPLKVIDDDGPPAVGVLPGDVVGYLDLETDELITCPNGRPLTRVFGENDPRCSDGSVPETYTEQFEALRNWDREHAIGQPDPQPAENGPNFQVILEHGNEGSGG